MNVRVINSRAVLSYWSLKGLIILIIFSLLFSFSRINQFLIPQIASQSNHQTNKTQISQTYGRIPLSFEVNNGNTDSQVKFLARGHEYSLFLTPTEAVLSLNKTQAGAKNSETYLAPVTSIAKDSTTIIQAVLKMQLVGANVNPQVSGLDELSGKVNYFTGSDPSKWKTNVSTFAKVKYESVYPGINLIYYGNQQQLEYDFVIAPGADPGNISLEFEGAEKMEVNTQGELVLNLGGDQVKMHKPLIYQEANGVRQEVSGNYVLTTNNQVGFQVGGYDTNQPLIIDPVLTYSTFLGGSQASLGWAIAVDDLGNAYVTGHTNSTDFPTTVGAYQTQRNGNGDAFVTKLNSNGSELIYSTYLGGSGSSGGTSIAVDADGNAYVAGGAGPAFPTTVNAVQPTFGGCICRYAYDGFITKLNSTGSALIYSTYLGGSGDEYISGIAVDAVGNAYVTGQTYFFNLLTSGFPTEAPFQDTPGGGSGINDAFDAFVTKLNVDGSSLLYSTYLGGNYNDYGIDIDVDANGNAYVTGQTQSTNFPITAGAYQTELDGVVNAFVTKMNPNGSTLLYSTFLGGSDHDEGEGIALDDVGNIYIAGGTNSTNFRTVNPFQATNGGSYDVFITKLNADGSAFVYSTYLGGSGHDTNSSVGGGIALDSAGNAFVTGGAASGFPTVNALYTTGGSFVAKIMDNQPPVVGVITAPIDPVQINSIVNTYANFTDPDTLDTHSAVWDWGDNTTSAGTVSETNGSGTVTGSHSYTQAGVYTITLTVTDNHQASGTSIFQYLAVYDPTPSALFSGVRIFTSPQDAYPQNPQLTGQIMFGISVKYDNNNNAPTGHANMNLEAANLDFTATSYQYLVISGTKATLKGNGTVNGSGNYTFLATGIDMGPGGGQDLIRFQIKDGSTVIYDTQPNASDTADPIIPVTAGQIIVH